ncbi:hypothetical protein PV326_012030, partial [Microctonus aethiopoides]
MARKMFGGIQARIPLGFRRVWRLVHLLLEPLYRATHASSYFRGIQQLAETDLVNLVHFSQALVVFVNIALEMSLAFIHPPSLELRGYINVKAMRMRRLERKWSQEGLQAFEFMVAYPFGDDYDEFDFFRIRWMQDGRWGQDHPAADISLATANQSAYTNFMVSK